MGWTSEDSGEASVDIMELEFVDGVVWMEYEAGYITNGKVVDLAGVRLIFAIAGNST